MFDILHQTLIKATRIQEMKLLIVTQILHVGTPGNVERTVGRICILMLGVLRVNSINLSVALDGLQLLNSVS